jgi:uracil-DNA glycosylase
VRRCNGFLAAEIAEVNPRAVLALGAIAHRAVLMALGLRARDYPFRHQAMYEVPRKPGMERNPRIFSSYHCSRYNTQTRRLTAAMFEAVFADIQAFLLTSP